MKVLASLLIAATSIGGPPLDLSQIPEPSCPEIRADGSLLDCEEERPVTMEFLVVIADDPSGCEQDSRSCGQTFVVRCDDYWSHQYGTSHAILINEARGPQERLTKAHFPARGLPLTLRVRRDVLCDRASDEHGFDSDCVAWDCAPECCVLVAGSDVHDDRVIPLDELAGYGSLPCLRVEHEPAPDLDKR